MTDVTPSLDCHLLDANVSRGIVSSFPFFSTLGVAKFITLCKVGLCVVCSVRDQALFDVSATLFNESMIREIITGRYLERAVSHLKDCDSELGLTREHH